MKWNEMEKYLLLANQQCIQMNFLRNECCFQWDLECLFNQIKSNQIILSNITCPIYLWISQLLPWIWVSEGRSKQLSKHNSHFISIYFSWLMCCYNFHDHWWLFCDYLDHHLQENFHWMKWYVVWEDLEWEMKWKWTIITYFQIQQHDNKQMKHLQKKRFLMMEDLKYHFHFHSNHISFFSLTF